MDVSDFRVKDRVMSKELREKLGIDDNNRWQSLYYSKTGCDGMGICCKKKTMIG